MATSSPVKEKARLDSHTLLQLRHSPLPTGNPSQQSRQAVSPPPSRTTQHITQSSMSVGEAQPVGPLHVGRSHEADLMLLFTHAQGSIRTNKVTNFKICIVILPEKDHSKCKQFDFFCQEKNQGFF